jgi:hypothetical protein
MRNQRRRAPYFERLRAYIKDQRIRQGRNPPSDATLDKNYWVGWQNVCEAALLVAHKAEGFEGIVEVMYQMGLSNRSNETDGVADIYNRYKHNLADMLEVARATLRCAGQ